MGWVQLAEKYDIPAIHDFCSYVGMKRAGLTGYPKASFWFGHHREGAALEPHHELMFETFPLPVGPDVHMLRSEIDAHLVSKLSSYGVDYVDHTELVDYCFDGTAQLRLRTDGHDRDVRARLVVDATGHASFFANKFDLRDPEPRLNTRTRTIFGHFRNVGCLETLYGANPAFRYRRDGATMHHCFDGGWIWVIPFDSGVTGVGLMLDIGKFPLDSTVSAEDELSSIIDRFPSVRAQLGPREPIRPLVRTGRVQFTSKTILGDGFVLTPHAAGFIDPLFSTGLTLTQAFIARFVPVVAKALDDGDFSSARFGDLDRAFNREVETIDNIVAGMIASFRSYEVFKRYWFNWILGTNMQVLARMSNDVGDANGPGLAFGASGDKWRSNLASSRELVCNFAGTDEELARLLFEQTPPLTFGESPYITVDHHEIGAPRGCLVKIRDLTDRGSSERYSFTALADSKDVIAGLFSIGAEPVSSLKRLEAFRHEAVARAEELAEQDAVDDATRLAIDNVRRFCGPVPGPRPIVTSASSDDQHD